MYNHPYTGYGSEFQGRWRFSDADISRRSRASQALVNQDYELADAGQLSLYAIHTDRPFSFRRVG